MPVAPTYPGVYIEEIPSGVRTITGVATSITAFVGLAPRGPIDAPQFITSFADYERLFGQLAADNPMGYSVFQFYQNGGSQAIIVRILGGTTASAATIDLGGGFTLEAKNPGEWGRKLAARVDYDNIPASDTASYNLTVRNTKTGEQERYLRLVADPASNRSQERVLKGSSLVKSKSAGAAGARPAANATVPTGEDPFVDPPTPAPTPTPGPAPAPPGPAPAPPGPAPAPPGPAPAPPGPAPAPPPATAGRYTKADATTGNNGDSLTANPSATPPVTAATAAATADAAFAGNQAAKTGMYQLLKTDIFNILVFPPLAIAEAGTAATLVSDTVLSQGLSLCTDRRAMLVADAKADWTDIQKAVDGISSFALTGVAARNAAVYFPYLRIPDLDTSQGGRKVDIPPAGAVAGIYARTDVQRGVWKAPAGTDASLNGVPELSLPMTDLENGRLNPLGLNCLRSFLIYGRLVWGARTVRGADAQADEYKYVPVRRLALFIEESLYRGTKWVVFEPNDEPLWAQIRLNVGAFMQQLFRQGAFQGRSPREAYFVKCDKDTTTQNDINLGIVNIHVGFAPLKPAEFVIIKLQQMAGQVEV